MRSGKKNFLPRRKRLLCLARCSEMLKRMKSSPMKSSNRKKQTFLKKKRLNKAKQRRTE